MVAQREEAVTDKRPINLVVTSDFASIDSRTKAAQAAREQEGHYQAFMSDGVHCNCLEVAGAAWNAESHQTYRDVAQATTERLFELSHCYYCPLG